MMAGALILRLERGKWMGFSARSFRLFACLAAFAGVMFLLGAAPALATHSEFPRPPELEPDVQFWERIYSKVTTQGGLLHDDRHLDVVYEEITFLPGSTPHDRATMVDGARGKYERILKSLAASTEADLTTEEQRVLNLFPANVSSEALRDAADHIRFQLGQADRFKEGLIRSGAWQEHVEKTLKKEGLPAELAVLPHVESSFNPRAYSKVGAAGLWQFMRATGRRWLRIDNVIDERLDPYKSTIAAAHFLNMNYSVLGSWPLALTAYNHGAGGMRKAKEQLGTDNIVTILRGYKSDTFGFASRNFYVSFLAALEISKNYDKYFGKIAKAPADTSHTLTLQHRTQMTTLERSLHTDRDVLKSLNTSLMDPIWTGKRAVPEGFELRVPTLVSTERAVVDTTHRVRRGETLEKIALSTHVSISDLRALNRLKPSARLKVGTVLKLPASTPASQTSAAQNCDRATLAACNTADANKCDDGASCDQH
jgi:membrane-bound lytic murein transglycosylase D